MLSFLFLVLVGRVFPTELSQAEAGSSPTIGQNAKRIAFTQKNCSCYVSGRFGLEAETIKPIPNQFFNAICNQTVFLC